MVDSSKLFEDKSGTRSWYCNGQRHRLDGPAVEWADGNRFWYQHDQLHRLDGPAAEWPEIGRREWWLNGRRHRLDGPAIEYSNGRREWYQHGQLHRLDGPAIERADGGCAWYLRGDRLTFEQWLAQTKCNPEQRTMLALRWS